MTPMTPPHLALDDLPMQKVLEGLSRLHPWVVVSDAQGRVAWMSESMGRALGGAERYVGATCRELFPQLPRSVYGELLRDRVRRGETLRDVRLEFAHAGERPLSVDLSAFPIDRGDGETPLIVLIIRSVEDRLRCGRERQRHQLHFREILERSPDGVLLLDRSSFITYANAAAERLAGERPGAAVGKPLAMYLPHAADLGQVAKTFNPARDTTRGEVEIHRAGGGRVWVSTSTRALRDADGRVECTAVFLRDVTERRRIQDALERKNAELESYVRSVSHDLRSPLVSLLGFSRLLRQDYGRDLGEAGNHFLDRVEQAGHTMEALIHDLLELSRIGRAGEEPSLVDPRAVLLQLQAEFKPRLDAHGARLLLPDDPPLLLCDRTRLYQLFSNLVGNAVRHMGDCARPEIEVTVDEDGSHHRIRVRDNGQGIPSESHERIFEIFQTLGPRQNGERSTGIGLAIVKKIAVSCGGRVWVESERGDGATFHVTLLRG